jgi:uncharacterized spore protein YtfJ
MDVQELLAQARDQMTVKRVFGDPIERNGTTVIPVANVMGGVGAGGGDTATLRSPRGEASGDGSAEDAGGVPGGSGYGAGYGLRATPAGVYVIRGGEVEWQPAVDVARLALQRTVVAVIAILAARSVVKAIIGALT